MKFLRIIATIFVIMIAYKAETFAFAKKTLVSIEHHSNQIQVQEWQRAITTIMASIPIIAIIIIIVIWWKPLNN